MSSPSLCNPRIPLQGLLIDANSGFRNPEKLASADRGSA